MGWDFYENMLKFIIKDIKTIKEIYPTNNKMIMCLSNMR